MPRIRGLIQVNRGEVDCDSIHSIISLLLFGQCYLSSKDSIPCSKTSRSQGPLYLARGFQWSYPLIIEFDSVAASAMLLCATWSSQKCPFPVSFVSSSHSPPSAISNATISLSGSTRKGPALLALTCRIFPCVGFECSSSQDMHVLTMSSTRWAYTMNRLFSARSSDVARKHWRLWKLESCMIPNVRIPGNHLNVHQIVPTYVHF